VSVDSTLSGVVPGGCAPAGIPLGFFTCQQFVQVTSKKELDNIRALIARDVADLAIAGFSADWRFATAYNAARVEYGHCLCRVPVCELGGDALLRGMQRRT
jgi:hypothetical protein